MPRREWKLAGVRHASDVDGLPCPGPFSYTAVLKLSLAYLLLQGFARVH